MEIKLTYYKNDACYRARVGSASVYLCAPSLRRTVDLPKGKATIYAVFTKSDTKPDCTLTITKPWVCGKWCLSNVEESQAAITWDTRGVLGRAYNRGYRYVRFESTE